MDKQSRFFYRVTVRIESTSNPKVKHLVRLRKSSRYRNEMGLFIVEGRREIEAIVRSGRHFEEIYFSKEFVMDEPLEELLPSLNQDTATFELSASAMNKVSYRDQVKSVIGIVKCWNLNLPEVENNSFDLILILDETEKPGNLGAILRTADAMGVDAIFLSDSCVDFFNPNMVRSSMGLFAGMPIYSSSKEKIINWLKSFKITIVGTSSKADKSVHQFKFNNPSAIVMGNEKQGLGAYWEKNVHDMIGVPLRGSASSLNLNSATACVLMEFNRQLHY
jgi:TrmH family RNA methyltransferase